MFPGKQLKEKNKITCKAIKWMLKCCRLVFLKKIMAHDLGWEEELPTGVAEMIKDRGMFGYKELTFEGLK